jgi:hypothetical protein
VATTGIAQSSASSVTTLKQSSLIGNTSVAARMTVPKFYWQGCLVASLACKTYLDHILNLGGRLCAHKQPSQSAQRTTKNHATTASERNLGTSVRANMLAKNNTIIIVVINFVARARKSGLKWTDYVLNIYFDRAMKHSRFSFLSTYLEDVLCAIYICFSCGYTRKPS